MFNKKHKYKIYVKVREIKKIGMHEIETEKIETFIIKNDKKIKTRVLEEFERVLSSKIGKEVIMMKYYGRER